MSDTWLVIVPVDPGAAPEAGAVEAARRAVERGLPGADEVTVERADTPQFIDASGNFERVSCPACGDPLDAWWQRVMGSAGEGGFRDLRVTTPCCATPTTLNHLDYDWPQAFARVSIHARNPQVSDLPPELEAIVERHLGLPTRIVWRHL